jgi:HEPN domain-containing protein
LTPADDIRQWIDLARYDLRTSEAMLSGKRYLYVLFTCQQATEKMLKALIVKNTGRFPPRIHDLGRLAESAGLELDENRRRFVGKLSLYYIESRYPEEVSALAREVDAHKAADVLKNTKELMAWLEGLTS